MSNLENCDSLFSKKFMNNPLEYDKRIWRMARQLCRGDEFLAEDLRSEMYIAILNTLESNPKADEAFCFHVAKCRAIDYLRSKSVNLSYGDTTRQTSFEAMEEAGFQVDTEGNVYAPKFGILDDLDDF